MHKTSQKEERSAQSADSLKIYSRVCGYNCSFLYISTFQHWANFHIFVHITILVKGQKSTLSIYLFDLNRAVASVSS